MARRSNAYSGYANPEMGEAFSNLARAMFGSAQDDQYIAAAQANRALAAKRQQEAQADADYQALLQQSAGNPLFQARALEAMGFGPATVDNGNLIRPVAPDGPQMSVPVIPGQADPATQANIRNLARTMLGTGGNIQQSMAGFETLGDSATARLADQRLLNPSQFSEDQLRGATILRRGAAGVDADFAPTTEAQNRLQNFITQRSNYGDDRRLEGTRYGVDNKPVVVGQNATAIRPRDGTVIGRGQQSPVNVPEGGTLVIPDSRQADFGGQSSVQGQPKTSRSGGSGEKPLVVSAKLDSDARAGFTASAKERGINLSPDLVSQMAVDFGRRYAQGEMRGKFREAAASAFQDMISDPTRVYVEKSTLGKDTLHFVHTPTTEAEYNKLRSGAYYRDQNGALKRKK